MKGRWTVSILASILIMGGFGITQQAFANPESVTHTNSANCDFLAVPSNVEELGLSFPPDELISTADLSPTPLVACPSSDSPDPNALVEMTNLTPFDFIDVWYVADNPSTMSNFDGDVNTLEAFKIDSVGLNKPLIFESITTNDIFESTEVWRFIIDDFSGSPGPAVIAFPGIPGPPFVSSGNIIAVGDFGVGGTVLPIDTTALLVAGAQTISPWLILGVIAAVGIGLAVFTLKRSR